MIDNLKLSKDLIEKKLPVNDIDYTILCKKFNRKFNKEKINRLLKSINNTYIYNFIEVIKSTDKSKYLDNFYSNLFNSRIIKNRLLHKILLDKEDFGENIITKRNNYIILGNTKDLEENDAELTPYHELLHLSTTKIDNKAIRIGFQYNDFAVGLNEGYTELLTKRYFSKLGKKDFNAYIHFKWFSNMLEEIIGKDIFEDLYFNSNIVELIIEIEKYISREKIFNLIEDMDLLFNSESELYDYEKRFLYLKEQLDSNEIDNYYDINRELLNRIYNTFIEINENKEKITGNKSDFKEKNSKIKNDYDYEEELYRKYFKDEKNSSKKRGIKK